MRFSHKTTRSALCLVMVGLVAGIATSAFAVPEKEILRITIQQSFTGACCFSWGETVSVTEPKKPAPVIVTFATDFLLDSFQPFTVGLIINGGPCRLDLGPTQISQLGTDHRALDAASLEWAILPSDGLQPGNNTFTLCGGGSSTTSRITLGNNTLTAATAR